MLSLELVLAQSDAYAAGSSVGLIVRTVFLAVVCVALVRKLATGRFGSGIRNSRAGAIAGLVAATGLLVFSVGQMLDRGTEVVTDPAYAQGKVDLRAGCIDAGAPVSYCDCLTTELDARVPAASRSEFSARMSRTEDFSQVPELQGAVEVCSKRATGG